MSSILKETKREAYEGLLESELSLAETDLMVDAKTEAYLPAKPGNTVEVRAGEVYLRNRSGARKSTGSYYTPAFAVEHLLDRALEPALDEYIGWLDGMPDREAGRRFFEFRVADIAMGSGHFLVGAVDRIERRLANYLAGRALPDVREEFARLRRTAAEELWAGLVRGPHRGHPPASQAGRPALHLRGGYEPDGRRTGTTVYLDPHLRAGASALAARPQPDPGQFARGCGDV